MVRDGRAPTAARAWGGGRGAEHGGGRAQGQGSGSGGQGTPGGGGGWEHPTVVVGGEEGEEFSSFKKIFRLFLIKLTRGT
jgi:hypothetical protein